MPALHLIISLELLVWFSRLRGYTALSYPFSYFRLLSTVGLPERNILASMPGHGSIHLTTAARWKSGEKAWLAFGEGGGISCSDSASSKLAILWVELSVGKSGLLGVVF